MSVVNSTMNMYKADIIPRSEINCKSLSTNMSTTINHIAVHANVEVRSELSLALSLDSVNLYIRHPTMKPVEA